MATTLAPNACAFSQAYSATLPLPETTTRCPSKDRPAWASISFMK